MMSATPRAGLGSEPYLYFHVNTSHETRYYFTGRYRQAFVHVAPHWLQSSKEGIDMVMVEFLSADGSVTASSSYPRGPIHFTETFLKTTPLIAGLQSGTQVLNIKTIEHIEGLQPTAYLKVVLEQRAECSKMVRAYVKFTLHH
ncbi:hypothetical protein ACFX15_030340 [Malus domestica]